CQILIWVVSVLGSSSDPDPTNPTTPSNITYIIRLGLGSMMAVYCPLISRITMNPLLESMCFGPNQARDQKVVGDMDGARHYGSTARSLNIWATLSSIFVLFLLIMIFIIIIKITENTRNHGYNFN
uniref:Uncharacterized protein n=1 Tax=Gasterosteus aculeatus aculeatus TaxID=481459 RepID=A0AAQ4Q7H8_GASAC